MTTRADVLSLVDEMIADVDRQMAYKHGDHDQSTHGQRGGSFTTRGGESLSATSRNADGQIVMADGSLAPDHIQQMGIPPAWADVYVNSDPAGDLLVSGMDSKGRIQSRYGETHTAQAAADKFGRVSELRAKHDAIAAQVQNDLKQGDLATRENAACLQLVMTTGMRPGSETDTGAEHESFGATTLLGSHVVDNGDGTASVNFVPGKKHGESIEMRVDDPAVARELISRAREAGDDGKLFDTSADKLRAYSEQLDGGGFKTKDHRTALGTETAVQYIRKQPAPKNPREYVASIKATAKAVASRLGNTPAIALGSYIDPQVFASWRHSAGVR